MKEVHPEKGLESNDSDVPAESLDGLSTDETIAALAESNSISAVALLRIYDVLMCIYADMDADDAKELIKLHDSGKLRSSLPFLDLS